MTSQLVIFRVFFPFPDPKSEKNSVNQLIKKFWPYIKEYGKCSKILSTFLILFPNGYQDWNSQMLVRRANRENPDYTASEEVVCAVCHLPFGRQLKFKI